MALLLDPQWPIGEAYDTFNPPMTQSASGIRLDRAIFGVFTSGTNQIVKGVGIA